VRVLGYLLNLIFLIFSDQADMSRGLLLMMKFQMMTLVLTIYVSMVIQMCSVAMTPANLECRRASMFSVRLMITFVGIMKMTCPR